MGYKINTELPMLKREDYFKNGFVGPELNFIKRTRPKLARGDVFALNLFEDVFFYGVVLYVDPGEDRWHVGEVSICILKKYTIGLDKDICIDTIQKNDVLCLPPRTHICLWRQGYLINIGYNVADGINFTYGIQSHSLKSRCGVTDESGEEMDFIPDIIGDSGFTLDNGVCSDTMLAILDDNSFLDTETKYRFNEYMYNLINKKEKPIDVESLTGFDREIYPFTFSKAHSRRFEVMLTKFDELEYLFEGTLGEGGGYDWVSIFKLYIKENYPEDRKRIKFDPEAEMFYMYSSNEELLKEILSKVCAEIKENKLKNYISRIKFEMI